MSTTSAQVSTETPAQRAAAYTARAHHFAAQAQAATAPAWRANQEAQAAKYLRFAAFALSTAEAQAAPVAPVEVAAPVAPVEAKAQAKPVRSERVQAMRRFYAVAVEHKLNTRDAQAMTEALSKYLGVVIPSRASLSAGQWEEASAAVSLGILRF